MNGFSFVLLLLLVFSVFLSFLGSDLCSFSFFFLLVIISLVLLFTLFFSCFYSYLFS